MSTAVGVGAVLDGRYRIEEVQDWGPPVLACTGQRCSDGMPVTLKVLNPVLASNREHHGRFVREAELLRRLHHRALPELIEVLDGPVEHFIVTELCAGESLDERLGRTGGLSADETLEQVRALLDLLHFLEAHGVVHRDLAPRNLVYTYDGRREYLRLRELRSARLDEGERLTSVGTTLGTPEYQAPEQISGGAVDGRTDLYALGCVGYAMLVGRAPFQAVTPHELMAMHLKQEPLPPTRARPGLQLPAGLEPWLLRCLRKSPDERFANARKALEALDSALRTGEVPSWALSQKPPGPPPAAPAPTSPRPAPPRRSRLPLALGLSLGLLLLCAVTYYALSAGR